MKDDRPSRALSAWPRSRPRTRRRESGPCQCWSPEPGSIASNEKHRCFRMNTLLLSIVPAFKRALKDPQRLLVTKRVANQHLKKQPRTTNTFLFSHLPNNGCPCLQHLLQLLVGCSENPKKSGISLPVLRLCCEDGQGSWVFGIHLLGHQKRTSQHQVGIKPQLNRCEDAEDAHDFDGRWYSISVVSCSSLCGRTDLQSRRSRGKRTLKLNHLPCARSSPIPCTSDRSALQKKKRLPRMRRLGMSIRRLGC